MNALARFARVAAALLVLAATGVHAGGPLSICNDAGKTPIAYSPAAVSLRYDRGNLGSWTKAQADTLVTNAVALWTNVGTATISIGHGADLLVDVTSANYLTYIMSNPSFSDGLNPVVYDTDGSIIDLLFGKDAKSSVLGFAGSAYSGATCRYTEGQAVINGFPITGVTDTTMSVVIAHEIGHLIGLDHTQLDNTQGLTPSFPSNYPLMYPIAYRDFVSLHEDEIAAVSALYPDATLNSVYGQISGTFVLADGTPVRGANLWANETTTNKVYSIVSDYRMQNTGYFKLLLPAGSYNLHAEAIQSGFNGGSSVGPYSEQYPGRLGVDYSFLPPLYVGGVATAPVYVGGAPMAPVTLGGGTPTSFLISAGCAATVTFRINGAGSVGGNCSGSVSAGITRLVNIATRGLVLTGDNVLIGGLIIGGTSPKTVLIRAVGPSMASLGVLGVLANPMLQLYSGQTVIASNDDWGSAANAAAIQATGLAPGSPLESAILITLAPGAYTAIVSGVGGGTGVGMVEVFEIDHPEVPLANLAARGPVQTGDNVMIGGFIIQGDTPKTVLIRAVGPSMASLGVAGVLANPMLQLFSGQTVIASNDDWGSAANAATIQASGLAPLSPLESAILITLPPGPYTAIVSGSGGGTGVGLVEVFPQ